MLSGYAATARREIERQAGVVEKFIGDAVVGVFGIPAPTRMTRCAPSARAWDI